MILPSDFDNAKAYDGSSYNALPVGGHICRIVGAMGTKSKNGNDMIELAFDIAENGPDDGRFKDRFDYLRKSKPDAKWPNDGTFRTAILTKDGKTSGYFKGVITAVEESNPGYSFKGAGCDLFYICGHPEASPSTLSASAPFGMAYSPRPARR